MRKHRRQLDASVGASGPHDFAVRRPSPQKPVGGLGTSPVEALAKADQRRSSRDTPRPPHPAPNVRDDRETPLRRARDGGAYGFDLGKTRSDLFLRKGLDR